MDNFTFQVLQAYNYWYPSYHSAAQSVVTLPCGHKGVLGAPMCKSCADTLISQSLESESQYNNLIHDLVIAYSREYRGDFDFLTSGALPITPPLPSFAEDFLNHLEHTNHTLGTKAVYSGVLGLFFAYLSPDPANYSIEELAKITHYRIEAFLGYCRKKRDNGPSSLAHKQSVVRSLYRYLIQRELLSVDVTEKLDSINVKEKALIALTPEDIERLASELESGKRYKWTRSRDRAIVFTIIGTGLRVTELCNLNIQDIDFQRGLLHILSKNDEAFVPFGEDVAKALRAYIELERPRYEAKQHSPALFLSIRGSRMSVDAVQVLVVNALESIGIKGFNTSKLRSTAAALVLRETGNLDLVQDLLRHKDPKTTSRYKTILQDDLRRAIKQIQIR